MAHLRVGHTPLQRGTQGMDWAMESRRTIFAQEMRQKFLIYQSNLPKDLPPFFWVFVEQISTELPLLAFLLLFEASFRNIWRSQKLVNQQGIAVKGPLGDRPFGHGRAICCGEEESHTGIGASTAGCRMAAFPDPSIIHWG